MNEKGLGRPADPPKEYAAFGIPYLDNMLEGSAEAVERGEKGDDQLGLQHSTVTALIGNSETQKSPLGVAFLSRCYADFAHRFCEDFDTLINNKNSHKLFVDAARILLETDHSKSESKVSKAEWQDRWDETFGKTSNLTLFNKQDGIPVLFTTQDVNAAELSSNFITWLSVDSPKLKEWANLENCCHLAVSALKLLIENHTICRRAEIHDLPPSVLIHIIQRTIEAAQRKLDNFEPLTATSEERFKDSGRIRVVIDDFSILRNTYIEVRDEPLLLRYLLFYLGREGVTTLIIDTQPGRPDTTIPSPLDSELRSLVHNHLYTWRFPFYGEDRVAIAAMPPISQKHPTLVRELRKRLKGSPPLVVDPHFELYSGIEYGEPRPVPLKIILFEESPAFQRYIQEENQQYCRLFSPVIQNSVSAEPESNPVIVGVPALEHEKLKEFSYLQKDTRLDHTLVFGVDEFWYLRRPGFRWSGSFRQQWQYLNAITAKDVGSENEQGDYKEDWERDESSDPFSLFQKTRSSKGGSAGKVVRRRNEFAFTKNGYKDEFLNDPTDNESLETIVDRVPFMWDFGFLLCKKSAWEKNPAVHDIWNNLPKSVF